MLKRPVIEGKYVDKKIAVRYFGTDDEIKVKDEARNNGHIFQVLDANKADFTKNSLLKTIEGSKFEVIGWINRTTEFPYDFLLRDLQTEKYFAATLHGRSDGWPLFAIQNEKPTCSRSRMGSDWNCRMCVKYFGTTCKAW